MRPIDHLFHVNIRHAMGDVNSAEMHRIPDDVRDQET
jgi:hypothetical protein